MKNVSVIDLFCGVGGLAHGFVREGFDVVAGIDADPSCEYAFETNNEAKFICAHAEELETATIEALYSDAETRVLVGCAPCQPFSNYNRKNGTDNDDWMLLQEFARLIEEAEPDVVSMENVTRLRKFKDGEVFHRFRERLQEAGYFVTDYDVDCRKYGVPQSRIRLVLFASKYDDVDLVSPSHTSEDFLTVRDAIENLPSLQHGDIDPGDRLHRSSRLSDTNVKRIEQSVPGGTWRDWDEELRATCHKRDSGKGYTSVYGRMEWDEPAPTITTQCYGFGNGRFGHPDTAQNRAISLREAALLQSFPKNYEFVSPDERVYMSRVGRYIGNAVPVKLSQAIARSIRHHLRKHQ